ncbi:MAG: hypothetical protein R3E41_00070 [Burkholderiaceae bacterium]
MAGLLADRHVELAREAFAGTQRRRVGCRWRPAPLKVLAQVRRQHVERALRLVDLAVCAGRAGGGVVANAPRLFDQSLQGVALHGWAAPWAA